MGSEDNFIIAWLRLSSALLSTELNIFDAYSDVVKRFNKFDVAALIRSNNFQVKF